jgi:hypothetical protein
VSRDRLHRVGGRWVELPSAAPAARPADSAPKSAWVAYAAALGVDSSGTKAAIIARCGDQLVESTESVDQVDPVSLVDEGVAQLEELDEGEPGIDAVDEDPDVFGHEDRG